MMMEMSAAVSVKHFWGGKETKSRVKLEILWSIEHLQQIFQVGVPTALSLSK